MLKMPKKNAKDMPETWSIGTDFVEELKRIFLWTILDHILMDRLNDILLEAFEQDFEAEEGIILNVGRDLRQRRVISEAEEGVIWSTVVVQI